MRATRKSAPASWRRAIHSAEVAPQQRPPCSVDTFTSKSKISPKKAILASVVATARSRHTHMAFKRPDTSPELQRRGIKSTWWNIGGLCRSACHLLRSPAAFNAKVCASLCPTGCGRALRHVGASVYKQQRGVPGGGPSQRGRG